MAYNEKTRIRSALRKIWLWSPLRKEAMARARVERGKYQCAHCPSIVGRKEIDIDHIIPATPPEGINQPEDWGVFIRRLLHCGLDGLVALCKPCHKIKTAKDRADAKAAKLKAKELSKEDWDELSEYTHEERVQLFSIAIEKMVTDGILSAAEANEYLENIDKILREMFL